MHGAGEDSDAESLEAEDMEYEELGADLKEELAAAGHEKGAKVPKALLKATRKSMALKSSSKSKQEPDKEKKKLQRSQGIDLLCAA